MVLENFSWGSWKVLEFFVSKRVGTLVRALVTFGNLIWSDLQTKRERTGKLEAAAAVIVVAAAA